MELEIGREVYLEITELRMRTPKYLGMSDQEYLDRNVLKGEVVKVDDAYIYVMSGETIIKFIKHNLDNEYYRLWLNMSDYVKHKEEELNLLVLKHNCISIIEKFNAEELEEFYDKHKRRINE